MTSLMIDDNWDYILCSRHDNSIVTHLETMAGKAVEEMRHDVPSKSGFFPELGSYMRSFMP